MLILLKENLNSLTDDSNFYLKNMSENNRNFVPLMPDGKPVPTVMLEDDLIRFLRLKEIGVVNPANTLRYYREIGKLRPTQISKRNVYTIESALNFLEEMTKKNGKKA